MLHQDVLSYQRVIDSVNDKAQTLVHSSSDPQLSKFVTQARSRYQQLCTAAKVKIQIKCWYYRGGWGWDGGSVPGPQQQQPTTVQVCHTSPVQVPTALYRSQGNGPNKISPVQVLIDVCRRQRNIKKKIKKLCLRISKIVSLRCRSYPSTSSFVLTEIAADRKRMQISLFGIILIRFYLCSLIVIGPSVSTSVFVSYVEPRSFHIVISEIGYLLFLSCDLTKNNITFMFLAGSTTYTNCTTGQKLTLSFAFKWPWLGRKFPSWHFMMKTLNAI